MIHLMELLKGSNHIFLAQPQDSPTNLPCDGLKIHKMIAFNIIKHDSNSKGLTTETPVIVHSKPNIKGP